MKNHRFLWLRSRTTDNRKCEKARNIKGKRTIEMFNTVSKQLVALRSSLNVNFCSQRDNRLGRKNAYKTSETMCFWGFSLPSNLYGMSPTILFMASIRTWTSR